MDSRHSNDEFSSKIITCSRPQNHVTNKTNFCYILIAFGDFAEVLSGQKEPRLSHTLLTTASIADKCTTIQYKFIQGREFGHNISGEIDNDDKKTLQ